MRPNLKALHNNVRTQTDSSSLHKHNRTEMKTVESFDKHSILLLLPFFFRCTEENKK